MHRYHFDIHENGLVIPDDDGQELESRAQMRQEALSTGAALAKDAFVAGSAWHVVIDVREDDVPCLKVSISLRIEER